MQTPVRPMGLRKIRKHKMKKYVHNNPLCGERNPRASLAARSHKMSSKMSVSSDETVNSHLQ